MSGYNGNNNSAFTLIELLVVVSIIAVLAAMLMPAISLVKRSAITAKFSSNLRQAGLAMVMYTEDYDSILPPYMDMLALPQPMLWQHFIQPYIDNEVVRSDPQYMLRPTILHSVLRDPTDNTVVSPGSLSPYVGLPARCMGMNGDWGIRSGGALSGSTHGATLLALSRVRRSSELLLLGPGAAASASANWGDCDRICTVRMVSPGLSPWPLKKSDYCRHGSIVPLLFIDQHVSSISTDTFWSEVQRDASTHDSPMFTNP